MTWFALFQKGKIFFVVLEDELNTELDIGFSAFNSVEKVSEGQFWLNHPELGNVALSVRDFCSEGRAKGVDVGE